MSERISPLGEWLFAAVLAFGPGPRQFSGSMSMSPFASGGAASGMSGRIAFGIGAVLRDMLLLATLWKFARRMPPDESR